MRDRRTVELGRETEAVPRHMESYTADDPEGSSAVWAFRPTSA